jgi:MtaA/CmuA family methyltransferase
MNSYQRMTGFINGENVDHAPFMPIFMRFCAKYTGTKYRNFIFDVDEHCQSNIACAKAFNSDWVNVMSDPYCEVEAYGGHIEYPEDSLPMDEIVLMPEIGDLNKLKLIDWKGNSRAKGRIDQCARYKELCGGEKIICGWVEGPVAEYCDLRSMGNAFLDFYDEPEKVEKSIAIILENARNFITEQVKAGANCIGIGDAACSQTGRDIYLEFAFEGEKMLVEHIHSLGAVAKLHICGNTTAIIPDMIATGADIIDIDHLVSDMAPFHPLLSGKRQVFCGNVDPVLVIQNGSESEVVAAAKKALAQVPGKLILSGGCEITPDTSEDNIKALFRCCSKW